MSNLKKVLALTLALAISLTMVVGAGFKDVPSSDTNAATFGLLADLKIAAGYDDGTYQPNTNLTRETAVTFIYRMATGLENADYMAGATKFADVAADRWSSGYINWAVTKNIVGGDPDGNFAPTRTVTVAELSKMMVVAMGYDVKNYVFPYGFVDKAQDLGLLSGLTATAASTPATRAMTALVVKNGLFSTGRIEIINNVVTTLPSFATSKFNIVADSTRRLTATSNLVGDSGISAYNKVELTTTTPTSAVYSFSGNADALLGRNVTVWYKETTTPANGLDTADTIVSIVAKGGDAVVSTPAASISSSTYKATINSKAYLFSSTGTMDSINYGAGGTVAYAVRNNTTVYGIDDTNDGTIDFQYAATPVVNKVKAISTTGMVTFEAVTDTAVATGTPIVKEQINAYTGMAVADIVYVAPKTSVFTNAAGTIAAGTVYTVEKANVVANVQLTAIGSDTVTYTFGGTGYKFSDNLAAPTALGGTYSLVLSPTGFVKSTTAITASTTTVYGVAMGATATFGADGTYKDRVVSILKGDGTSAAYAVLDSATIDAGYVDATKNWTGAPLNILRKAIVLTVNADGKVTTIAPVTAATDTLTYSTTTGFATLATAGTLTVTADTIVFYIDTNATGGYDAIKAYQGANIPAIGSALTVSGLMNGTTGVKAIKVVVVSDPVTATASNNGFIQYTGASYVNSATVYNYKIAYKNGTIVDATSSAAVAGVTSTPVFKEVTITNGVITIDTPDAGTDVTGARTVTAKSNNVIADANGIYTIASDAKILVMDVTYSAATGLYTLKAPKAAGTLDSIAVDSIVQYVEASNIISFIIVYNVVS